MFARMLECADIPDDSQIREFMGRTVTRTSGFDESNAVRLKENRAQSKKTTSRGKAG
jgi:hypothetical protein